MVSRSRPSMRMPSSRTSSRTIFLWSRPLRLLLTRASRRPWPLEHGLRRRRLDARRPARIGDRRHLGAWPPGGQVVGEADQQAGGGLGVRQGAVRCVSSRPKKSASSAACRRPGPDRPRAPGSACRGSDPARSACRRRARPEEGEVEADVVADEERVAGAVEEPPAAAAGAGALATSLSVMPWSWLPTMGRPGLTRVDQRSVILPPLTLTAPISTISPSLASGWWSRGRRRRTSPPASTASDEVERPSRCRLEERRAAWPCRPAFVELLPGGR